MAMFADIPFLLTCCPRTWTACVLGAEGPPYPGDCCAFGVSWLGFLMPSLTIETLSGRLGFAVLAVVCRARGEDTDCFGRAVLEALHKISSAAAVCKALHLWLRLVSCSQSGLSHVFNELKCVPVEKHEGQLLACIFLNFTCLLLSGHGSKNLVHHCGKWKFWWLGQVLRFDGWYYFKLWTNRRKKRVYSLIFYRITLKLATQDQTMQVCKVAHLSNVSVKIQVII